MSLTFTARPSFVRPSHLRHRRGSGRRSEGNLRWAPSTEVWHRESARLAWVRSSWFVGSEEAPAWDMNGEPWSSSRFKDVLHLGRLELVRREPQSEPNDVDAAVDLSRLAHSELEAFGSGGVQTLDDDEIAAVLRTLRTVLKRLGVQFDLPFRDFKGFHGFWSSEGMSGSGGWAARRAYLSNVFNPVFTRLDDLDDEQGTRSGLRGVDGQPRNLIFASTGPKPDIVLRDAIDNVVEVTRNAEHCLFYDRMLNASGLSWGQLCDWWRETRQLGDAPERDVALSLYRRLAASVHNNSVEYLLFRIYCELYGNEQGSSMPALLPQVYLHYDPSTWKQRSGRPGVLARERMDFLVLFPHGGRVVIEVDGKQHYAEGDIASPRLYSQMVAEDRRLRLRGYEIYRFGGFELGQPDAPAMLRTFFTDLLASYPA